MRARAAGLIAAALAAGAAHAARVPPPDPAQGDGRVSAFYTWTEDIPAVPGQLLRSETLDATLGLANAGRQLRILYSSTDGMDGKTPVAVSGVLFMPKGSAPPGGWPVVAWAHGTTGIADICAPSWQGRSFRDVSYLNAWLAQGYAVVATDYQGLGTPGPHPYLATRPEAFSVLDGIRAALRSQRDLAGRIVIVGQSQGGGAAFAAGGLAPTYAPELDIRGVVATGVPFVGSPEARPQGNGAADDRPDGTTAYVLYLALLAQQQEPALQLEHVLTPRALPVLQLARVSCVGAVFSDVMAAGLNRSNALQPDFHAAFNAVLPALEYQTLRLRAPVFVGTGENDRDTPTASQLALVRDACAAGSTVEAHLYRGLNHGQTVNASLKDSIPFVRAVMAGQPIHPVCEPTAE